MAPLWKPASSLTVKKHTVAGQVKPIGQRGRPALLTGAIIHDASTLLLVLTGDSISRYKEPNKKAGCFEYISLLGRSRLGGRDDGNFETGVKEELKPVLRPLPTRHTGSRNTAIRYLPACYSGLYRYSEAFMNQ